uniref:Uncharacterized protein n=1 Tax=Anguilla anguilla TaxID=7936 RepID=A0A0E9SV99_ANGAN
MAKGTVCIFNLQLAKCLKTLLIPIGECLVIILPTLENPVLDDLCNSYTLRKTCFFRLRVLLWEGRRACLFVLLFNCTTFINRLDSVRILIITDPKIIYHYLTNIIL